MKHVIQMLKSIYIGFHYKKKKRFFSDADNTPLKKICKTSVGKWPKSL